MCEELGNARLADTAPWQHEDGRVGGSRMWVGCHVSTAGGMERAVINAAAIGMPVSHAGKLSVLYFQAQVHGRPCSGQALPQQEDKSS